MERRKNDALKKKWSRGLSEKNDPALKCVRQIKLLHTGTQSYSLTLSLSRKNTHLLCPLPLSHSFFLLLTLSVCFKHLSKPETIADIFVASFRENNFNLETKNSEETEICNDDMKSVCL